MVLGMLWDRRCWCGAHRVSGDALRPQGRAPLARLRARSGGLAPFVPVMESSNTRHRNDLLGWRRLRCDEPTRRSVLAEAEMGAVVVEVADVGAGESDGVQLVEHDDVIEESRRQPPIQRSAIGFCQGLR